MNGIDIRYKFNGILVLAEVFDKVRIIKSGSPYPRDMYVVRHKDGTSDLVDPSEIIEIVNPD